MEINREKFMRIFEMINPVLINDPIYCGMERQTDRMFYIQKLIDGARNEASKKDIR